MKADTGQNRTVLPVRVLKLQQVGGCLGKGAGLQAGRWGGWITGDLDQ